MDIPVNYEAKTKDSFFDVIKSFFATSIDNEDEVDKRVKKIDYSTSIISASALRSDNSYPLTVTSTGSPSGATFLT